MGFIKDIYIGFQELLLTLISFDYSKLVILFSFFFIIALMHLSLEKKSTKRYIRGVSSQIKKINAEANYKAKKIGIVKLYLTIFSLISLFIIMGNNLTIFLPVIAAISILFILALKEQLNNIFLGLMFKSPFNTTIYEGLEFYFLGKYDESFKVVKVNLFKSIIKSEQSGRLETIENKKLNSYPLTIKPFKKLNYVNFSYIVDKDLNINEYKNRIENFIKKGNNDNFDFSSLRDIIFELKGRYNSTPYLKPSYEIRLNQKDKDNIELIIEMNLYDYDMSLYPNDYFYLNPNRKCEEIIV